MFPLLCLNFYILPSMPRFASSRLLPYVGVWIRPTSSYHLSYRLSMVESIPAYLITYVAKCSHREAHFHNGCYFRIIYNTCETRVTYTLPQVIFSPIEPMSTTPKWIFFNAVKIAIESMLGSVSSGHWDFFHCFSSVQFSHLWLYKS